MLRGNFTGNLRASNLCLNRRFSLPNRVPPMKKKCPNCQLINFPNAENCARCQAVLCEIESISENVPAAPKFLRRALICCAVIVFMLAGFYGSLVFSAKSLSSDERKSIERAIAILEEKGFSKDAFLLKNLTVFRGSDNWLNASVEKDNAYAATNFPFEIVTIYPDFFTYSTDDTERAAILLHEAQHLKGGGEKDAYEFVWRNRKNLGWTKETYAKSVIWINVRKQTKEYAPNIFVCELNENKDCTE